MLELVVSRGRENTRVTLPNLVGLSYSDALARLGQLKVGFSFTISSSGSGDEKPGTVVAQNPGGGTEINSDQKVTVSVTVPDAAAGEAA
jgi:beta-lactam-binding protein with PASTA domain